MDGWCGREARRKIELFFYSFNITNTTKSKVEKKNRE